MECIIHPHVNCKKGIPCPSGYECCSQTPNNGSAPTFGLCVKQNYCDKKRGIPKKGCKDEKTRVQLSPLNEYENFSHAYVEGYCDSSCSSSKVVLLSVILVAILSVIVVIFWSRKRPI